jgi:predicted  nucleic acid-binding Zn-ribbon protein
MLTNTDKDHAAQIAADCLRNLQIQRIQQEINQMTELMKTAETAEKQGEALREVAALSKELARLKQQGR